MDQPRDGAGAQQRSGALSCLPVPGAVCVAPSGIRFAWSPDGRWLACAESFRVRVIDVQSGEARSTVLGEWHGGLAVSPDGELLTGAAASGESEAEADARVEALARRLSIDEESTVLEAVVAPDGSAVACAIDDEVRVYCARTGELRSRFPVRRAHFAQSLSFSPDGCTLAAVMWSGSNAAWLCAWDLRAGVCLPALAGVPPEVAALAFSADGGVLVAALDPGPWVGLREGLALQAWDARAGALRLGARLALPLAHFVALVPEGPGVVAATAGEGPIRLWDACTGALRAALPGSESGPGFMACAADGSTLAWSSEREVHLWDARAADPFAVITATSPGRGPVRWIELSADGSTLIAQYARALGIWDARTGALRGEIPVPDIQLGRAALSPDGSMLVLCLEHGMVDLWDARAVAAHARLPGAYRGVTDAAFLPDGATLVLMAAEGDIHLHDVRVGTLLAELPSPEPRESARGFVLSPDGRRLATIPAAFHGRPCAIHIWDLAAGERCATLPCTGLIRALAFSPDGRTVAFATGDGVIHLVEAASGRQLARLFANAHGWVACAEGSPYFTGGGDLRRVLHLEGDGEPLPPEAWARFDRPDQVRAALAGERLDLPADC